MKTVIYRQAGAALLVSLLFLIVLTILSLSAMNLSITEQQMSANTQYKMEALQQAQSVVDATLTEPTPTDNRFRVLGSAGYTICDQNRTGCDQTFTLSGPVNDGAAVTSDIVRLDPNTLPAPRGIDTSADKYHVALFRVDGKYDNSTNGYGRSNVSQGYLVLVPKGGQ